MANKEKITIKLNNLKFDAQNPRLPMRLQGVTDENKVIDYMVKYGNVTELMLSIGETGYSEAEPLLVVKEGTDKYIVVEGNRRLAALKLLNDSELTKVRIQSINSVVSGAKYIPEEVPCIVYASREDVLDYLGYRHITGVLDIFIDEDLDELQRGEAEHSLKYDKLSSVIGNYYEIIKYRKSKHPEYYPFDIEDDRCIVLKDNLENKHLHYIYLLLCSSLSFMDQSSMQKITHAFEKYCCPFMRLLVPVDARTELFGTTRDTNLFHGNLRSRIEQLAEFLGAQTTKTMDADKRYDRIKAGDAGLDIVSFLKLDEASHIPVALAQCTCSYDEWINKQESINSDTWRTRIDPIAFCIEQFEESRSSGYPHSLLRRINRNQGCNLYSLFLKQSNNVVLYIW